MARAHPRRRRVLRVVGIVLGVLVLVGIAVYQVWPYRGVDPFSETPPSLTKTLTHDQAVADLDYAFASIKDRHMATVHGVPEALQRRYEQARDSLPAQPTVLDVWRAVSWLANALADAHTGVSYPATTAASRNSPLARGSRPTTARGRRSAKAPASPRMCAAASRIASPSSLRKDQPTEPASIDGRIGDSSRM